MKKLFILPFFVLTASYGAENLSRGASDAAAVYKQVQSGSLNNTDAEHVFKVGQEVQNDKQTQQLIDPWIRQRIQAAEQQAGKDAEGLVNSANQWQNNAKKYTQETQDLVSNIKKRQKEVNELASQLATKDGVNVGEMLRRYGDASDAMLSGKVAIDPIPTLLVFVSLSMPKPLLEQYAEQTAQSGGKLVLQGLVDNSMKKTVAVIGEMMVKHKANLIVDPTLFNLFQVNSVPLIVVTDGKISPCADTECQRQKPTYDSMSGNVSLYYALEKFSSEGEANIAAMKHLTALRASSDNKELMSK